MFCFVFPFFGWREGEGRGVTGRERRVFFFFLVTSEAVGLANTIRELGHEAHVRIWTDAARRAGFPQW